MQNWHKNSQGRSTVGQILARENASATARGGSWRSS
jgi:hypothetical protein